MLLYVIKLIFKDENSICFIIIIFILFETHLLIGTHRELLFFFFSFD